LPSTFTKQPGAHGKRCQDGVARKKSRDHLCLDADMDKRCTGSNWSRFWFYGERCMALSLMSWLSDDSGGSDLLMRS